MKCNKCNNIIPDDSIFCEFCGVTTEGMINLSFINISRGVTELIKILCKISQLYDEHTNKLETKYVKPRFIFRGVSAIYDNNKKVKKLEYDFNSSLLEIRSGLSIKLRNDAIERGEKNFSRIHYINYLEKLIRNARKHYPVETKKKDDLSILAEIQHNGGATCLVDFSKSILTAIWFACQDNFDCDAVLYCYDIIDDIIVNDKLNWLKDNDVSGKSIRSLLWDTNRDVRICGEESPRFCVWEPDYQNLRMIRQDSLFVFGIEKFKIQDHSVKTIIIKAERKKYVLSAMKSLFNITGSTIYDDYVGYAFNHSKTRTNDNSYQNDYYLKGLNNIIYGNYASARDYLKLYESIAAKNGDNHQIQVELQFSIAVCYKNIGDETTSFECGGYIDAAIAAYKRVVEHSTKYIKQYKEKENSYYYKKIERSYNNLMDLYFKLEKYEEAYYLCNEIVKFIKNNQYFKEDKKERVINNCYLQKFELLDLILLRNQPVPQNIKCDNVIGIIKKIIINGKTSYRYLLLKYYYCIYSIIKEKDEYAMVNYAKVFVKNYLGRLYKDYSTWNFDDMKKCLENLKNDNHDKMPLERELSDKKITLMLEVTANMISLRDIHEMDLWNQIQNEP